MSVRNALAAATVLLLAASAASAQVIDLDLTPGTEKKHEIWEKASEDAVKKAEEAARQDACVRLVEAAYRLPVSSTRDVYDMMIKNEQVNKDLIKGLGAAKAVAAKRFADGTVRVTVVTTPLEVTDILKKAYARVDWDLAEEDHVISAVATQTRRDTQITAEGVGALPGSAGERCLALRRAARLKAEEELATEVLKFVIREEYTQRLDRDYLRGFIVDFPQMPRKLALGLASTRMVSEELAEDGTFQLRAELDVVKATELVYRGQSLYDERRKWADWGFTTLLNATRDMILKSDVKVTSTDKVPANTPLALELEAVDRALKVPIKDDAPKRPGR